MATGFKEGNGPLAASDNRPWCPPPLAPFTAQEAGPSIPSQCKLQSGNWQTYLRTYKYALSCRIALLPSRGRPRGGGRRGLAERQLCRERSLATAANGGESLLFFATIQLQNNARPMFSILRLLQTIFDRHKSSIFYLRP